MYAKLSTTPGMGSLAGWGLEMVANLVVIEVWNWLRQWCTPPLGIDSCIIFQTNHLAAIDFAKS